MRAWPLSLIFFTLTLNACKGEEPAGDSAAAADLDGDGYAQAEDCDDNNAAVNPGAEEVCDALDNNCDGLTDDDASDAQTFYGDEDDDGYAGDAVTVSACAAPDGFSDTITDCDDLRADVNPAADELCDGADNNCDGLTDVDAIDAQTFYSDADEDGYAGDAVTVSACEAPEGFSDTMTDCDDLRADVNPAADERCDAIDNDCDSLIDDDDTLAPGEGSAWLLDDDGDGFGDSAAATVTACVAPAGYVAEGGDCDSADAAIYPGAVETCDALDNDCDGLTDDDDSGVSGLSTWFADDDGDSYGDSRSSTEACAAPKGYIADKSDCDDRNAKVSPAATEICDGGVDNDCDGLTEDDDPSVNTRDGITVYLDGDGDGFGVDGSGVMFCALPSGYATLDGDCDDSSATVSPDGVEVCDNGIDEDCSGDAPGCGVSGTLSVSDADVTLTDSSTVYFGYDLGSGDINGDGYDDLVIGGYGVTIGSASGAGRSYILYGPLTADRTVTTSYDATIDGVGSSDVAGKALAMGGDLDGDGYDDIAIGASNYDPYSRNGGGLVGLRYGSATKLSGNTSIAALDASFAGAAASDALGSSVKFIGDMNGDGYDELAIGAWATDSPSSFAGAVYIIPGSATRSSGMSTVTRAAKLTVTGTASHDYVGHWDTIVGPIDLDGDGLHDLVVSSAAIDSGAMTDAGGAYVFYGTAGALSTSVSFTIADADASFSGDTPHHTLGHASESAGDVNGDGYDDLVVNAPGVNFGCAYLILGGATRFSGTQTGPSTATATMCGIAAGDSFGKTVGGADVNNDGYSDVYTGAVGVNNGTTYSVGAMYVFYGPLSGNVSASAADATFTGSTSSGYVGHGSHTADANGDGAEDLLVGAYGEGKVYALFGGGL